MRVFAIAVSLLAGPAVSNADNPSSKKPSDADIRRLVVGKWKGSDPITGVSGTIDYAKDGTFSGDGVAPLGGGQPIAFHAEGTWKVSGGAIHFKITKSSRPGIAPIGIEIKEVVLAIDSTTIRYKRGLGKEKTRVRVKSKP